MNDEDVGRLAQALLRDLDARETYEGRLLAVVRVLWHVDATARDDARARLGDIPGFAEAVDSYRASCAAAEPDASVTQADDRASARDAAREWFPDDAESQHARTLAAHDVEALVTTAPGPLTGYCRRLAFVVGSAQLACQWGCLRAASPMLWWCTGALGALRARRRLPVDRERDRLASLVAMAAVGATAADLGNAMLATAIARRLTAELGAVARAAAAIEGAPDLDPEFIGPAAMVDSVAGPQRAPAADLAQAIASSLNLTPGPELRTGGGARARTLPKAPLTVESRAPSTRRTRRAGRGRTPPS